MLNRKMRIAALSLALSLVIGGLSTGCGMLGKEEQPMQTETQKQSETMTEKVTQPATETETETEMKTNVAYTSQDKSIRITLPDTTWKVTQDVDEMRVFSSGNAAMINIVHAADASAMKKLSVADSENALKENLTKQYPDANAFEVVEFEKLSSPTLDTYEYVVKYNATSMWAYSVTYGIMAKSEAYVITGTVLESNKVLLDAVQKSVESFTVLRNGTFSALPGTVVNKTSESQTTQSESGKSADNELKTLTEYGAGTDLYASELVNIRQQPSTEANVLGSLQKGDKVTVVGETSQWFKVNINGNIGYINKAFLVYNPPSNQSETTQTDGQVEDSTRITAELNSYIDYGAGYTYYATTDVNLRAQPGTSSGVVNTVNGGTAVSVIGETDNWFVVSVNGSTGYISKSYISSTNPGDNTGNGNGNGEGNGGNGNGGQTSGTGTISGTVIEAGTNTITVQGDDGHTYTINYTDASLDTSNGLYSGLYITATVDYSGTSPTGDLYATSVSGH